MSRPRLGRRGDISPEVAVAVLVILLILLAIFGGSAYLYRARLKLWEEPVSAPYQETYYRVTLRDPQGKILDTWEKVTNVTSYPGKGYRFFEGEAHLERWVSAPVVVVEELPPNPDVKP